MGGHLVRYLAEQGFNRIRAVDIKPPSQWYQTLPRAEVMRLDLTSDTFARDSVAGCSYVFNLAPDIGGMGFIARNLARCMLSVMIDTPLLAAARDAEVSRYFYASSACVYRLRSTRPPR